MLNKRPFLFRNNGGTCQKKMPRPAGSINMMSYRIPEMRHNLPFVDESRLIPDKQGLYVDFGKFQNTGANVRVGQIKNAFRELLACSGLPAPLRPFDKNGAHALKLARERCLHYPLPISSHNAGNHTK